MWCYIFQTDSLSEPLSSFSWALPPHWTPGCQTHHCHTETHNSNRHEMKCQRELKTLIKGALRIWEWRTVPSLLWVGLWSADAHWSSAGGSASVLTNTPENKYRNVTHCMLDTPAQTHTGIDTSGHNHTKIKITYIGSTCNNRQRFTDNKVWRSMICTTHQPFSQKQNNTFCCAIKKYIFIYSI